MARTQGTKVRPRGKTAVTGATQTLGAKAAQSTAQVTATAPTQLIEQQQSTEVVQSLLHGSISCLAYLRSLFTEGCFDEQWYENSDTHWPYEDYAAGNYLPEHVSSQTSAKNKGKSDPKAKGTCMRVLRRGRSASVDTLLDWLEKGAFEALKRGHLRAIQLNIFEDASKPSNVMETYTFTFNYVRSPDRTVAVAAIEMSGPRTESVTIKNAKYAMQMFIRRLIALCGTLPDLPSRRYLNMHLFYTDDCDPDYEPPGFERSDSDTFYFPDANWKRETVPCGTMDAGFNAVTLKVSYLRSVAQKTGPSNELDRGLPSGLSYTAPVSRDSDIQLLEDPTTVQQVHQAAGLEQTIVERAAALTVGQYMQALTVTASASQSSQKSSHGTVRHSTRRDRQPQEKSALTRIAEEALAARSPLGDNSNDEEMDLDRTNSRILSVPSIPVANRSQNVSNDRPAIRIIDMSPSPNTHQTQPPDDVQVRKKLERMLEPSPQDDEMVETQQTSQPLKEMDRHLKMVKNMSAVQLSERKVKELDSRRSPLLPPRDNASSKRRRSVSVDLTGEKDIVSCQCGWDEDEDDMINCSFCDTWQHLHCYGYCGSDDPRIPVTHACYNCLLHDKEAPLLSEMRDLALQRRGMHRIEKDGWINDRNFSSALNIDLQTASRLIGHLRKQGYVVATPGSHSRGYDLSKPKYTATLAEPVFTQMMREYFDPLTKVSHHFVELFRERAIPIDTDRTTHSPNTQFAQAPLPPGDAVFGDSMEADDPEETQDDVAMGQPTPKPSSSFHPSSQRNPALAARQNRRATRTIPQVAVIQVDDSQGSQATRYPLRHRYNKGALPPKSDVGGIEVVMPAPKTPGYKRARNTDQENLPHETPAERAKRLKISMSQSLIDIGEMMTPSPVQTPLHRNILR